MEENTNIAKTIATETAIGVVGLSTSYVVTTAVKALLPYAVAANPYTRAAATIGTTAIGMLASDTVVVKLRTPIKAIGQLIDEGKNSRKIKKEFKKNN